MKRLFLFLLILPFCLTACTSGKTLGGDGMENSYNQIDQEMAKEMMAADDGHIIVVLRFSSFSGGGYEYNVEVEDPSIISFETRYEYEDHAGEIDGASFDYIVSFTGLKAGSTIVKIYGRSPILENDDYIYSVAVDEKLTVTLTPVKTISTFFIWRMGDVAYDSYRITMDEDGYCLSINEEEEKSVSTDIVVELMEVIDQYDVAAWDGFIGESDGYVLDGENFWLEIEFTDGTRMLARGDNVFPKNYYAAMGAMWPILTEMAEENGM